MLEHSPDQETESAPSVLRLPPPVGRFPSFRVNVFSFVVSKGMCPWLSLFQPLRGRGRGRGQGPSTETARGVSRLIPLLWLPGGPMSPGGRLPTSGADRALSLLYVSILLSQPALDCATFLVTTVQRPWGQKRLDLPWCFAIFSEPESAPTLPVLVPGALLQVSKAERAVSSSAGAATTTDQRPSGLQDTHLLLTVLLSRKAKTKVPADSVSSEDALPGSQTAFACVSLHDGGNTARCCLP